MKEHDIFLEKCPKCNHWAYIVKSLCRLVCPDCDHQCSFFGPFEGLAKISDFPEELKSRLFQD